MQSRKEMKKKARIVLKKHYWLFVILCLFAAVLGTEFSSSLTVTKAVVKVEEEPEAEITTTGSTGINEAFGEIIYNIGAGNDEKSRELANEITKKEIEETKKNPDKILGRSRGVFSGIINGVTSGTFLVSLAVSLRSMVGSNSLAVILMILASMLIFYTVWVFGINLYQVIMRRMVLEGRCYDKVHMQRSLYLLRVHKWCRAGLTLFVTSIYKTLWMLTIVGGIIKRYSYYLVPYIVAENPSLRAGEAVTLSRKLMNGHKWECFVFEVSFIGWNILGVVTLGLSNILYTNPYKIAAYSEYYAELRRQGKERRVPLSDLLDDRYLFEKASEEVLTGAYKDIVEESKKEAAALKDLKGIHKFLSDVFGVTIWNRKEEKAYEESQARQLRMTVDKEALDGFVYPARLSLIPEKHKRKWVENSHYIRNYSVWSIILIFFAMSFIGWVWEVSLHLVSDGVFVNRGVLHGPWLPIYGTGSILILLLLNKFRRNPALEFVTAVIVCGCVEYFTSYYLEVVHNGKKWWDYSGYFLNLNGRICAEGLLTFGVGGMAIVYVLAPLLDNLIRKIPYKALIAACLVLLCTFTVDQVYSKKHPNEGKGITDYKGAGIEYVIERQYRL